MSDTTTTETKIENQNQNQEAPPETSLSTSQPTTNYQASDLDMRVISRDNNKILRRKVDKISVQSKKDTDRQKWLKNFEWNNNDIKAYTSIGIDPPEHLGQLERQFLSLVDIEKGAIQRSVMVMIRCKAIDYSNPDPKKQVRKEYLFYMERWEGLDWRGIPLNSVDSLVGRYTKQFLKPHINQTTGEIDYHELDATAAKHIHYIPFSKKAVDDIIAKSSKTDKQNIKFKIKFESEDCPWGYRIPTRAQFSYEQFANWKWDDIYKYHTKPNELAYHDYYKTNGKTGNNLAFEPS